MDDVLNGARAACEERTTALCALRAIEVLDGDQVANSDQQTAIETLGSLRPGWAVPDFRQRPTLGRVSRHSTWEISA